MTDYPHKPAAFINLISEEGTKAEAVKYLQLTWNELCHLKENNKKLKQLEKTLIL